MPQEDCSGHEQHAGLLVQLCIFHIGSGFYVFLYSRNVNPTNMADDMKKNGGFIPGVKPGKKTAEYLDAVMSRITLPGSIFLGL